MMLLFCSTVASWPDYPHGHVTSESVSVQVLDKNDNPTSPDDILGVIDVLLFPPSLKEFDNLLKSHHQVPLGSLPLDREVDMWLLVKSTSPNALPGK